MFVVGIDLGTTNSAMARAGPEGLQDIPVLQRVSETEVAARPLLPSFLYLPGAHELPPGSLALPWDEEIPYLVGELARIQGARVPGRLVSSAKSWLAHRRVDPAEPILPWEGARDCPRVSALEASTRYLEHLRRSWDYQHPDTPLARQEIVLTVPASFDEVAREYTVLAARQAGLEHVTLQEEPQAAFYAWLWRHPGREGLPLGQHVLVCDIGGGTTDFTLIRVGEHLERVAVGEHLMLGGDNLDIALAHHLEERLGRLDLLQWGVLRQECRRAKEILLGQDPPEAVTVTVPGSGARLLAEARTAVVSRQEVEALVLEGFFPVVDPDEPLRPQARTGLRELGLPYAADPAVPRHLAAFLRRQGNPPVAAVLFNGGACRPAAIRRRLLEVLSAWSGRKVEELPNPESDLAVSRGAAWYGWLRRQGQERIRGGVARSYYVALEGGRALCLIPRNLEEGRPVELEAPEVKLRVDRPVSFPLYCSADRPQDRPGDLLEAADLDEVAQVQTVVRAGQGGEVPVHLGARVSEVGTLELWCASRDRSRRWTLQIPLRGTRGQALVRALEAAPQDLEEARRAVAAAFLPKPAEPRSLRPRVLAGHLEDLLRRGRQDWSPPLLRALWEPLYEVRARRRADPEYEAAWLNLAGWCLRPGLGYPLDDWRCEQMGALFPEWMQFAGAEPVRREWWVMWRRLAAGLPQACQEEIWSQLAPTLLPGRRHLKTRLKGPRSEAESTEILRLAASLEKIPAPERAALGQKILERYRGRAQELWLLARLGARRPLGAGPQHVLAPEVVEPWVEAILTGPCQDRRAAARALLALGRCTGQRGLDLDPGLRERAAAWLLQEGLEGEMARPLLEVVEVEEEEREMLAGEALPLGLSL
jgi:molecular chaperone DnaK (HSP70)